MRFKCKVVCLLFSSKKEYELFLSLSKHRKALVHVQNHVCPLVCIPRLDKKTNINNSIHSWYNCLLDQRNKAVWQR